MPKSKPAVTISRLRFEHLRETLGIGVESPRLSWMVETTAQNWQQAAYEIECYNVNGSLRRQIGRVESDQSVLVDWPFEPLQSREQLRVRVRVWVWMDRFQPGVSPKCWKPVCSSRRIGAPVL